MTISCLHFNARGYISKENLIKDLVQTERPDIISLQETFLSDESQEKIKLNGYHVTEFRRPRSTDKGGMALCIKESISRVKTEKITTNKNNEYIKMELVISNQKLEVASFYNRRSNDIDTTEIDKLLKSNTVVFGDLNCRHQHWEDITSNSGGKKLSKRKPFYFFPY